MRFDFVHYLKLGKMEDKICEGLIYLELEGIKFDKIPKFKFERSMRAPQLTENGENILARGEFLSWCSALMYLG
jgi:hypothetical protein